MLEATDPSSNRVGVIMDSRGCDSAGKTGWLAGADRALRKTSSLRALLVMMKDARSWGVVSCGERDPVQ